MEVDEVVGDPCELVHSGVHGLVLHHTKVEGEDGHVQHLLGWEGPDEDTLGHVITGDLDPDGVVCQPQEGDGEVVDHLSSSEEEEHHVGVQGGEFQKVNVHSLDKKHREERTPPPKRESWFYPREEDSFCSKDLNTRGGEL